MWINSVRKLCDDHLTKFQVRIIQDDDETTKVDEFVAFVNSVVVADVNSVVIRVKLMISMCMGMIADECYKMNCHFTISRPTLLHLTAGKLHLQCI